MENLIDGYLKFHPDTLQVVRQEFNLHQPGRMDDAIDILEEWIKKQDHFLMKDFSRGYLERFIIWNKGLLEKAKKKIDKKCTLRNLMPEFYAHYCYKDIQDGKTFMDCFLPKMTENHERIYLLKIISPKYSQLMNDYFKTFVMYWEYLLTHDYNKGYILIFDLRKLNVMEHIKNINLNDTLRFSTLGMGGYCIRIKSVHLLTSSKFFDILLTFYKPIMSNKMVNRAYVHQNLESLHNIIPKQLLPLDYGGEEQSVAELFEQLNHEITSEDHLKHLKIMKEASTDETRRPVEKFNEEYLGIPGTFRKMVMD